jgi:transposase/mannose-6-phosphate isomerase-like protein (cupin superfamily)
MLARFRQTPNKLQVSIVETRRSDGKVQVRDVDIGRAHVAIGVVHRRKLDAPAPQSVAEHDLVSEVYHVIDGSGTLVLGPDIIDMKRRPADEETVRLFNGPGNNVASIRNGVTYELKPGDVVVISAGTGHWFTKIDDHITYLMVRIDPEKVTPVREGGFAGNAFRVLRLRGARRHGFFHRGVCASLQCWDTACDGGAGVVAGADACSSWPIGVFFCPTRISSWNHTSIGVANASRLMVSSTRAGKLFFKGRNGLRILRGVAAGHWYAKSPASWDNARGSPRTDQRQSARQELAWDRRSASAQLHPSPDRGQPPPRASIPPSDPSGAGHKAVNGFCTQIGHAHYTWLTTTASESRGNFLELLRAGDYVINAEALLGDKAYDSNELRDELEQRGTKPVIPNRSNRKQRFSFSKRIYKLRWRIESAFNRLKDFRRIATRYDKLARNYLASVCLAQLLYGGFNESGP